MTIQFNEIPVDLRVPGVYVEIDPTRAVQGVFRLSPKVLIIGQRTGGIAALGRAHKVIKGAEAQMFGRGSQLAAMISAYKAIDNYTDVWAMPVDDLVAGTPATGTLTIAGTATGRGTVALIIGGRRYRVGVVVGATAASVATDVAATITADIDGPCVASAAAGVVTVTARQKGEAGTSIEMTVNYYAGERSPPGLTVSFPMPNPAVGRLSGGAGNPDITPLIAALGDEWWTDIIIPWTDAANLNAIETEAARRFGPMVMQDLHIWTAAEGGLSGMSTLGSSRNSPHLTIFAQHWSLSPCWIWAASCAAVAIYNLAIDPARPLQTLAVPGLLPPLAGMRADFSTRNLLLRDGISTYRVDDGGRVVIERVITTYQTNAFGADDTSFLDVETLKSLAYLRYDLRTYLSVTFPRHKLADDDSALATAPNTVTPKTMRAHLIARYMLWRDLGLVEAPDSFKNDVRVERDESDPNRLNCLLPPDLVNQLRITAAQIQYLL